MYSGAVLVPRLKLERDYKGSLILIGANAMFLKPLGVGLSKDMSFRSLLRYLLLAAKVGLHS